MVAGWIAGECAVCCTGCLSSESGGNNVTTADEIVDSKSVTLVTAPGVAGIVG